MPGPVQSIERAAAILRLLAQGSGRLGLSEIANSLGLARGTAHGILRTLQLVGFVEQDEATGKYQLGAALLHLGTSYLDVNELRSRAINWADALAARSGEAVRIGTHLQGKVLVVHHVFRPDDSLQTLDVGMLLPMHATAIGKVLLAYDANAAAAQQDAVKDGELEQFTRRTVRTHREMSRMLATVREHGWASDVDEAGMGEAGWPPPSGGTGDSWWARWASPAPPSGSATPAGVPAPTWWVMCATRRGPSPATSAPPAGDPPTPHTASAARR